MADEVSRNIDMAAKWAAILPEEVKADLRATLKKEGRGSDADYLAALISTGTIWEAHYRASLKNTAGS